jgi:hypothetical protein
MDFAEKLQLHYYLNNGSHSMDALVRNKCEAEILAVIQEISNVLALPSNVKDLTEVKMSYSVLGPNAALAFRSKNFSVIFYSNYIPFEYQPKIHKAPASRSSGFYP